MTIQTLSRGCFTGLEDRIKGNRNYSISVECASNKGVIFIITGKKLAQLEKMSRIWHQIMTHAKMNVKSME